MPINPMDLTDRRILVTGASSGIGRATALLLSRLGAKVVLLARNQARLQATLDSLEGDGHGQCVFDLNATDEIPAMMKSIALEHGQLSGLFHSAGLALIWPVNLIKKKYIDSVFFSSIAAALMLSRGTLWSWGLPRRLSANWKLSRCSCNEELSLSRSFIQRWILEIMLS